MKKNKVISDWLDKYNDPEIDKKVKMKLEEITKGRSNQIIDGVYENYFNVFEKEWIKQYDPILGDFNHEGRPITQEEFINKCKTDKEFSERWGLKIEERELIDKERVILYEQKTNIDTSFFPVLRETLNFHNIPTKLITITYNNQTIESYE